MNVFQVNYNAFSEYLSKDFNLFMTFGFLLLPGDTMGRLAENGQLNLEQVAFCWVAYSKFPELE